MSNRIFKALLEEKIEIFKSSFSSLSKAIFFDQSTNKLIHPGEFGMYRETLCKEFIRFIIPRRLDIEQGFLLNPNEEISHQCDIVVFDKDNTPLIENTERQRFFPIETVSAIGEIKSILNKGDFAKALNKLSMVKPLRYNLINPFTLNNTKIKDYNPLDNLDQQLITFLICQKLDFDFTNIENEIDNLYEKSNKMFKHNLILSIEDGLILYESDSIAFPYPNKVKKKLKPLFIKSDMDNIHFKVFASNLFLTTSNSKLLFPHIANYLI